MDSFPSRLSPPLVVCFAATDPTGGGGIQADLMALSSMGCHPLSVITALTVQDTVGISSVLSLEPDWVEAQARSVLEDMPVDAFKIGWLGNADNAAVIAAVLADYPDVPVVFDPGIAAGRGSVLLDDELLSAIKELLLPQATVLTINSVEARLLADDGKSDVDDLSLDACAERLLALGCRHVLMTGAHENTWRILNMLYGEVGVLRSDSWNRLPGSFLGAGDALAAAVAAGLAQGLAVDEAVREAQEYTWQTLVAGFRPGMGQLIPDRFCWARRAESDTA